MDTATFLQELYRGIPHGFAEIRLIYEHLATNSFSTQQEAIAYRKSIQTDIPKRAFIERHEDAKTKEVSWYVDVKADKKWRPLPVSEIHQHGLDRLHNLNREYHVYQRMGISTQQRSTKADIAMLPAIWLDVDDNSPEAYNQLLNMDFYPNIITFTGGGFHAYWLLAEPISTRTEDETFEIERTMDGMVLAFGGKVDPKTKDITRILRTPGFKNIKVKYGDTKPICRVAFFDDARYQFKTLHQKYAALGKPKQPQITRYIAPEFLDHCLNKRVKTYLQTGAARGNRNNELYYCARAYLDAGYSQFDASNDLTPRARADGLPDNQIVKTIGSAYKNAPNPTMNVPAHMRLSMAVEDSLGGVS